jgi:hypothetical protein
VALLKAAEDAFFSIAILFKEEASALSDISVPSLMTFNKKKPEKSKGVKDKVQVLAEEGFKSNDVSGELKLLFG